MDLAREFGVAMKASRIIVNSPSGLGGIGNIYNRMTPSLTLGTGSWGELDFPQRDRLRFAKRKDNCQEAE